MCRKLFLLMSLVLMLCGNALADHNWEGDVSSDWNTAGNWDLGAVPPSNDKATIGYSTSIVITNMPVVSGTVSDVPDVSLAKGTLTIASGAQLLLAAGKEIMLSQSAPAYPVSSTVNMQGGTIIDQKKLTLGRRGTATLNMTNENDFYCSPFRVQIGHSHHNSASEQGGYGRLQLDAGIFCCASTYFLVCRVDDTAYGLGIHNTGLVDITGGTLVLPMDEGFVMDGMLDEYIADGRLTAYGGGGTVVRTYTSSPVPDCLGGEVILVTGIPEPATIALLGLGGLVLLRRRHS